MSTFLAHAARTTSKAHGDPLTKSTPGAMYPWNSRIFMASMRAPFQKHFKLASRNPCWGKTNCNYIIKISSLSPKRKRIICLKFFFRFKFYYGFVHWQLWYKIKAIFVLASVSLMNLISITEWERINVDCRTLGKA